MGNPLTYYNGSSYSFTWQGRQLVGATYDEKEMSFEYNADGLTESFVYGGIGKFSSRYAKNIIGNIFGW